METSELLHIQSLINDLSAKIDKLSELKNVQPEPYKSDDIKDLALALAKAQGEMEVAGLNKVNPYFKSNYSDLKAVVQASRPYIAKHGLCVVQPPIQFEDGQYLLYTILMHGQSGQWIHSRVRIVPPKNDVQSTSSYVTYTKRMCYAALIGVVTGDEDDDGEAAVATSRDTFAKGVALNAKYNPKENPLEVVSKEQLEELEYELGEYPDIAEMVLDGLKINSLADMPKSKYHASMTRIRSIKNSRNGIQ